jgi:hypothetical protein
VDRRSWSATYFVDVYRALCAEHGIDLANPGPENLLHREVAWQIAALHLQARNQFHGVRDGRNGNAFNKTLSTALKLRERLARLLPPAGRPAPAAAVPPVPEEQPSTPPPVPPPAKRLARTSSPEGAAHARAARARQLEERRTREEERAKNGPLPIHPALLEAQRRAFESGPLGGAEERCAARVLPGRTGV